MRYVIYLVYWNKNLVRVYFIDCVSGFATHHVRIAACAEATDAVPGQGMTSHSVQTHSTPTHPSPGRFCIFKKLPCQESVDAVTYRLLLCVLLDQSAVTTLLCFCCCTERADERAAASTSRRRSTRGRRGAARVAAPFPRHHADGARERTQGKSIRITATDTVVAPRI